MENSRFLHQKARSLQGTGPVFTQTPATEDRDSVLVAQGEERGHNSPLLPLHERWKQRAAAVGQLQEQDGVWLLWEAES